MPRLRDSAADLRALIDATAEATKIRAAFVEKDFWVTEMLRSVAAPLPGQQGRPEPVLVIFKGGTSLSKAYGLIARFSEDVDILLDAPSFGSAARDRVLKAIGARAAVDLRLAAIEREKDRGVKRYFEFEYPRAHQSDVISARVRLEMGFRGGPNPHQVLDVTSYIAKHAATAFGVRVDEYEEFAPVRVAVLAPERTLVEKLACLHQAAVVATTGDVQELRRVVRHFYDVRQLLASDAVLDRVRALPGGVPALAADVREQSVAWKLASEPRPTQGYATSPAFDRGASWTVAARDAFDVTVPQLVWGACPTFDECLDAVHASASLI